MVAKKGGILQVWDTWKKEKTINVNISALDKEDKLAGQIIKLVTDSKGEYELLKGLVSWLVLSIIGCYIGSIRVQEIIRYSRGYHTRTSTKATSRYFIGWSTTACSSHSVPRYHIELISIRTPYNVFDSAATRCLDKRLPIYSVAEMNVLRNFKR